MLFNSLTFVVFFAAVLAAYHALPSWRGRKALLLVASYLFYAAWSPPFVLLLWLSTAIDWSCARALAVERAPARRRLLLGISLAANLGMLGYFKYGGFLLENFTALAGWLGIAFQPAAPDIVLPVGISFYTFQTLSYTLDVYRGRARPSDSRLDYALYVTFFPQLVAGPIVRATDFLPQCKAPPHVTVQHLGWGLFLLSLGLFEKVVVADTLLAPAAEAVFGAAQPVAALDAWIGVLAFSGQIFCDFAGYSTCAIGAALCLGFALPDNFRFPYAAIGFSDFWRRWHISLSTWLRDYLYVPLGGNRGGVLRTHRNLMITMLLGGLWHGASWNFVLWGGLHGLYLVLERGVRRHMPRSPALERAAPRLVLALATFGVVSLTWVFFRAADLDGALGILAAAFGLSSGAAILLSQDLALVTGTMALVFGLHWTMRERRLEDLARATPAPVLVLVWALMWFGLIVAQGSGDAFIYFQF